MSKVAQEKKKLENYKIPLKRRYKCVIPWCLIIESILCCELFFNIVHPLFLLFVDKIFNTDNVSYNILTYLLSIVIILAAGGLLSLSMLCLYKHRGNLLYFILLLGAIGLLGLSIFLIYWNIKTLLEEKIPKRYNRDLILLIAYPSIGLITILLSSYKKMCKKNLISKEY